MGGAPPGERRPAGRGPRRTRNLAQKEKLMPHVSIDIPDDLLLALREQPEEFTQEVRLVAAIHYLREKRLSLGQASRSHTPPHPNPLPHGERGFALQSAFWFAPHNLPLGAHAGSLPTQNLTTSPGAARRAPTAF